MFELRSVEKRYSDTVALRLIDLEISPGQTTILIGPSGCGKSTLLRLLVGLIRPTSGRVLFQRDEITPNTVLNLRRRIGYVIQDGGLFPHLTARRNATLMADYIGMDPTQSEERLRDLAEMTHFPYEALDRFPGELSGGQRQRVSLMRALMLDPEALLMDEPLGALDPMIRAKLQEDLRELFQRLSKTVVMVTHDLGEAVYLGDHIVLMREGGIVQQGEFRDMQRNPADPFVTEFINAQRGPLESKK